MWGDDGWAGTEEAKASKPNRAAKYAARPTSKQNKPCLNAVTQRIAEKRRERDVSAALCTATGQFARKLRRILVRPCSRSVWSAPYPGAVSSGGTRMSP